MDAPFLLIFLFMLSGARAVSHEAVPAEVYWRTFLPKTPIPATIQELIQSGKEMGSFQPEKSNDVFLKYKSTDSENQISSEIDSFEHEMSPAFFVKYKSSGTKNQIANEMNSFESEKNPTVFVKYKSTASKMDSFESEKSPEVFVKYKSIGTNNQISNSEQEQSPAVFVEYKSTTAHDQISDEMDSFASEKSPSIVFKYKWTATENPVSKNPNAALLFLEESLRPGTKMTLDLTKMRSIRPFLSACKARDTPFSLAKLPEILSLFSIKRDSPEAAVVQRTLAECEELQLLDDERRRCATSVESIVEFVEAELGSRDIRVLETALRGDGVVPPKQEYMVGPAGARLVRAEALVSCHPEPYPRAVYYCHRTTSIEAYKVQLMGANGVAVDAVATCHTDTSAWSPEYIGFSLLKVKPGTHICHFMPQGHLIFAGLPKNKANAAN